MFSGSSFSSNTNSYAGQDGRSAFSHSHSHPAHQGFTVAGMSSLGGSNALQSPNLRGGVVGGGGLGMSGSTSFGSGSSLGESRSHYQPGYLMSVNQDNNSHQGSQRHDEAPMVQTKAKLSHSLLGGSVSDFGMDSMFEGPRSRHRQRQPLADEDAPPTNSVNDIVNEVYVGTAPSRHAPRNSVLDPSTSRNTFRSTQPSTPRQNQTPRSGSTPTPLYLIVFGYPPDKYSVTVEYFRSLGETTEPEQHPDISNCFRIGYNSPAEAMRAVRKNGDVLSATWMVGVKWADPAQAEAILGSALVRSEFGSPASPLAASSPNNDMVMSTSASTNVFPVSSRMNVDEPGFGTPTPTVGTPIRLAPSAAAFRKPGTSGGSPVKATQNAMGTVTPSASKGVLEQVGDLIFGW